MNLSRWHLEQAARIILKGGVISYPTEAVYGLGCDPWDLWAVSRILSLKKRSISKGLIVIASCPEQLESLIVYPDQKIRNRILSSWPGPNTWVLPASAQCPWWLTGAHDGLAVRVTAHPLCRMLCEMAGPIVSTSANIAEKSAARTAWKVQMIFNNRLDMILRGSTSGEAGPTRIRDAITGKQLR